MANKPTKTPRQEPTTEVEDLEAQKDPKGGAQKREGTGTESSMPGGPKPQRNKSHL